MSSFHNMELKSRDLHGLQFANSTFTLLGAKDHELYARVHKRYEEGGCNQELSPLSVISR